MIVETSATVLRNQIKTALLSFLLEEALDEEIALQIIEIIALRMRSREDYQVSVIGAFVRVNLFWLQRGLLSYCEALERFTHAATHAALGHATLVKVLHVTIGQRDENR